MARLRIEDIIDLTTSTRPNEGLGKLNDLASRLTSYVFTRALLEQDKITYDGGTSIKSNFLTDHNNSAAMVGLHEVIEPNIPDVLQKFDVPWRHLNSHWGYERREILANAAGKTLAKVVDILDTRRIPARIAEAELLETQWWTQTPSASDNSNLWGIQYWLPYATSAAGSFQITVPSGFTTVAGLDPSVYTRWKGYGAQYINETEDDLIHEMNLAADETNFVPPVDMDEHTRGVGKNHRLYLNLTTKTNLEEEMRRRNDRHTSLSDFSNATSFRNSPLRYVPKLNSETQSPVYMLNMDHIWVACLSGDEMYEHEPMNDVRQPNTYIVHRDATLNAVMTSRRHQAVINKAA